MKWIVISCLFSIYSLAQARTTDRQLLKCLGEEEKRFHLAKETGPIFDLNQRLINEMLQIPKVELNHETYQYICGTKGYESLRLLSSSITKGKNIFVIPNDVTGMQKSMTQGMIDDYTEVTKEILLSLIAQIQTLSPTPHCLEEEVPGLSQFFSDIKHLQEDVDIQEIFKKHEQKILKSIEKYPNAFYRCRERLKKKLKSESKSEAKKP